MYSCKFLPLLLLIFICCQRAESKIVNHDAAKLKDNQITKPYPIAKKCIDTRGLQEVWISIKESAISSWTMIKGVADNTRERIKQWMQGAKKYATKVRLSFKEQLGKLKEKMEEIMNDLYGTGDIIMACYEQEKSKIQGMLSGVTSQMGKCITKEVKKLMQISSKELELSLNNTEYISELEDKFETCEHDSENVEDCMYNIRKEVFDDIQEIENQILENSSKSRNLIDNVKNTLVTCSLSNLADASYMISNEVMVITKCVMEGNINEDETSVPEIKPED